MKRRLFYFFSAAFLSLPFVASAIGGGGGGFSPPTCDQDSYSCTEWNACSPDGRQTRTCSVIFDCPGIETPKPPESQSCTPPEPSCVSDIWSCTDWTVCASSGIQSRTCTLTFDCSGVDTPKPSESRTCAPPAKPSTPSVKPPPAPRPPTPAPCDSDSWKCGDWSPCDIYGNQQRSCQLTFDCPAVNTPSPATQKRCAELQCGRLSTLRERVTCRLNLEAPGLSRELELEYLPEECRALSDKDARASCISRYKSLGVCWSAPVGEERFSCARSVLNLGASVRQAAQDCQGKTGAERAACAKTIQERAYAMIKFRFYDLEERAEDLVKRGAPADAVTDFVTLIETKKQEFNAAASKQERQRIILDVRKAWKDFIAAVQDKVK